nr:hypothetical protein [uncultured Dysosmobacter sp.]
MAKKKRSPAEIQARAVAQLRETPIPQLLSSLELTVGILRERGVEIRDWEDKKRHLTQFRMLGNKAYFFAERKEG